jgi:hypothetical protein
LELLSFLGKLESRTGLFGDLRVSMQAQTVPSGSNHPSPESIVVAKIYNVTVKIPQRWYTDGHLMVGFKEDFANTTGTKSAGIDDIKLSALCGPM